MRPCYIQIKKGEKVSTKRGRRERTDWHLLETMQYEDTARLFVSLGGEPIETDFDFIKAIYDEYGEGIYSCVSGKKGRRGFWSFLLFGTSQLFVFLELCINFFYRWQTSLEVVG